VERAGGYCSVTDRIKLFERRNRLRIAALLLLATFNYIVAAALAAVAIGLGIVLWAAFEGGVFPDSADTVKFFVVGVVAIVVTSAVIGVLIGLVRIPFARRSLERRVLEETGARITDPAEHSEIRDLLEGLAIATGLPIPRVAVIEDPAPNSFGVGTNPSRTVIGVTTGLADYLTRDELEAILAYEVTRIRSWYVALASWTVALTSGAISAVEADDDHILRTLLGLVPRWLAQRLQVWALRDEGNTRDRAAIQFTRNPTSLIHALEKLDAEATQIRHVSRATAPLWVEFPAHVLGSYPSRTTRQLAHELLLDERIDHLRELAGLPRRPVPRH
jgi:heat shock protein HtpX